jgi:hypothetical protein
VSSKNISMLGTTFLIQQRAIGCSGIGVDFYSKKVTPAFFVEAGVESNDVNRFSMLMPFSSGISPALCADVDDVDKCFERTMAAHLRTSQSLPDRQWLDNKERC